MTRRAAAVPGVVHVATAPTRLRAPPPAGAVGAAGYVVTEQPILAWPGRATRASRWRWSSRRTATRRRTAPRSSTWSTSRWQRPWRPMPPRVRARRSSTTRHRQHPALAPLRERPRRSGHDGAVVVVERTFRTNRHTAAPMEGRGGVADYDAAAGKLTLWSGTQVRTSRAMGSPVCSAFPSTRSAWSRPTSAAASA